MRLRSLWPWLLGGALLASSIANVSMYQGGKALAGGAVGARAQDPARTPSFHLAPGSNGEHCPTLELLGLTEEQSNQIRKCSLSSLDVRTGLAVEIEGASTELKEFLAMDNIEGERILELADRISSLRSRQYRSWIGSILVVRDVLTPEQLRLLHQLESN